MKTEKNNKDTKRWSRRCRSRASYSGGEEGRARSLFRGLKNSWILPIAFAFQPLVPLRLACPRDEELTPCHPWEAERTASARARSSSHAHATSLAPRGLLSARVFGWVVLGEAAGSLGGVCSIHHPSPGQAPAPCLQPSLPARLAREQGSPLPPLLLRHQGASPLFLWAWPHRPVQTWEAAWPLPDRSDGSCNPSTPTPQSSPLPAPRGVRNLSSLEGSAPFFSSHEGLPQAGLL